MGKKYRFRGEKIETFMSNPPGVRIQIRPGQDVTVDEGFAYFAKDPRFEVVEAKEKPAAAEEPKAEKPKK